jgi:hypothetical protein
LLHAFGDSAEPLEGTVNVMESILKQELGAFVLLCENLASLSNSKTLEFREAILVMKHDKHRVFRLYKYLGRCRMEFYFFCGCARRTFKI